MSRIAVGIDIGGTRTKSGLVDLDKGTVLETIIIPTEKKDSDKFLESITSSLSRLKSKLKKDTLIEGVGFGVPGFVFENGVVDSTYGFLDFMEDYPLSQLIEEHCGLQCRIDNDARVVALGEALYGTGKGFKRILVLTLGTGLGLGFIADNKLETRLPYAHMGGHMTIRETDFRCYCGKQGCLENLVSATGIIAAAERLGWKSKYPAVPLSVEAIFNAEQNGNTDAAMIVNEFLDDLRTGIDNYINIFAPEIVIIGGGIAKGMQKYLHRLSKIDFLTPFKEYKVKIALSELDELSGILGSAALFND